MGPLDLCAILRHLRIETHSMHRDARIWTPNPGLP